MNIAILQQFIHNNKLPKFRFEQLIQAIFKDHIVDFNDITTLSKDLRSQAANEIQILSFTPEKIEIAKDKQSIKALVKFADNISVETVIMEMRENEWTACLSSQAGCPIGCAFCATGQIDLARNLVAEEISDQVLFWQNYLAKNNLGKLTNIVLMGMGEPFLNWPNVKDALRFLTDEKYFGFGDRSISISTVGLPGAMAKMAKDFPQINLALSLHSADNKIRSELVPMNNSYNLKEIRDDLNAYVAATNRKVMLEYILIDDVNDTESDADKLAEFVHSLASPFLYHVNLIVYNQAAGGYRAPATGKVSAFKHQLERAKVSVTIRKSLGSDISAACGQLARKRK